MDLLPKIKTLKPKKLVGKSMKMSLVDNKTSDLWRSFMTNREKIKNAIGSDLYSMQVYDESFDFQKFDPAKSFTKWAAIEVSDYSNIPEGFNTYDLNGGLYAIFIHRGSPAMFHKTFQFIFGEWLPNSDYQLDNREHFEVLGSKYNNNSPDSEEEVWVPVKSNF